jgi:hypothetical protein
MSPFNYETQSNSPLRVAAVIPIAMVDEVAQYAADQDDLERFIMKRMESGAAALGTYPPNEETKAAYQKETGKPAHW